MPEGLQCQVSQGSIGGQIGQSLTIGGDAAALMAAFAMVGWGVATIVYHLPVSSSTRATAAAVRDHALFAAVLSGLGSAIAKLVEFALQKAAEYAGSKIYAPDTMLHFNLNSATVAGTLLAFFAAIMAIGPALPVIGAFLTFVVGVIYSPAIAILGTILVMAAVNAASYFVLVNSMFVAFPVGIALYAAPGRVAKGIGAFLISLSVVSYVALPILPHITATLMSVTGGGVSASDLNSVLQEICSRASQQVDINTFLGLFKPTEWYGKLQQWLTGIVVSSVLLALIFAAARALSHSLGGVSASL
ncbi:MAG: hypothetical protein QXW56_05815 [Nitrososphaerota archaeon]